MLESMFIMLLIMAIILLMLSVVWESIVLSIIDVVMWLVLAIGALKVEIPYQYISSGTVYEATQEITDLYPITYLFMGIAVVMAVYWSTLVLETLRTQKNMMRGI